MKNEELLMVVAKYRRKQSSGKGSEEAQQSMKWLPFLRMKFFFFGIKDFL